MKKPVMIFRLFLLICAAALFSAPDLMAETNGRQPEFRTFDELNGKRISMLTGAPFEEMILGKVKEVESFSYFNNMPDMLLAIKAGKTDAGLSNNAIASLSVNRNPQLMILPENLQDSMFGIAFAKGDPQLADWQSAYDRIPEETKQAMWEKWTGADESLKKMPPQDWPGKNGTIRAAVCDTLEPLSYTGEGGEILGFDAEMILLLARELDVHVEFEGMELSGVLASVQSGRAQIGAGSIIVSPERREAVDFLEYWPAAFVLVVRASQGDGSGGFVSAVISSFEKTFLRENRWKMFLEGIGKTLLITVLSILFGTALGFSVYLVCRAGNPAANAATRFVVWLIQGMPGVVLLMILYHVVFGKAAVSGTTVSVIGFSLIFGCAVYGMIHSGVAAVDAGQTEAAYALGYSDRRTFFRVIWPQALPHIIPFYKGEITALIKMTAVVGYIAVQDLTRTGDLIRSRTYEAFFPLIAVAVLYYVLAAVLIFVVNRLEFLADPRRRSPEKILKGVKTHD